MRVVAFYLPQFYEFEENSKWWGEGFTEWTNVKKSKPLFKNHYQPTVPLDENYYCLKDVNVLKWQIELAKKYGVYGFCFYHYWFGEGRQLMEIPVDNYLSHKELDFPFCLCWANHNWTRTWTGGDKEVLMDMRYGDEAEWKNHFDYLLPFFKDSRYILIDEKPVLVIYQPQLIPNFIEMRDYINKLAIASGLKGVTFISQSLMENEKHFDDVDYNIQYEPNYSRMHFKRNPAGLAKVFKVSPGFCFDMVKVNIEQKIKQKTKGKLCKVITYDYDRIWNYIIKRPVINRKEIAGAFVKCDVTPRRQDRALIYKGHSPHKFEQYLSMLIKKVSKSNLQQYIFLSAWNEWGEGMYIEPDMKDGYAYLEAVKNALER